MRMMMIAHHHASCCTCTCTRGHALIVGPQKQYRGIFPVAVQAVVPTSLLLATWHHHNNSPADIHGMQGCVSPAATQFLHYSASVAAGLVSTVIPECDQLLL
jgi:hypothetical protein